MTDKQSILEMEMVRLDLAIKRRNKIIFALILLGVVLIFIFYLIGGFDIGDKSEDISDEINITVFEIKEPKEEIIVESVEEIEPKIEQEKVIIPSIEERPVVEAPKEGIIRINITQGYVNNVLKNLFAPDKLDVEKGAVLEWHILDEKRHKISCYDLKDNWRVFSSKNFYPGETIENSFDKKGKYLCVDAIYGARGYISVR